MKTFTLKTDFFDNETNICIGGEFGAIGILTVVRLLCAIQRSGYYLTWSEKTAYSLMRDIPGLDRKTLNRIIKRLIYWKMFDAAMFKKHSVLTSIDLQQRYFKAASRRRRALQSPEPIPYLLIPLNPKPQPSPDNGQTDTNREMPKSDNIEITPSPEARTQSKPQKLPQRRHTPPKMMAAQKNHNQRYSCKSTRPVAIRHIFRRSTHHIPNKKTPEHI